MSIVAALFRAVFVQIQIHTRPDGDCVGSGAALCRWLLDHGIDAVVYSPDEVPARLAWVLDGLPVVHEPKQNADLTVSVDSPAPFMWGRLTAEDFDIVIDHHPRAKVVEMATGALVHHRPETAATAQILAEDIIPASDWTPAIATALFVGLHQDTGGFVFSNTSPQVLELAGRLVAAGVDVPAVNQKLAATTADLLKTLGQTLATVREEDGIVMAEAPIDAPAGPVSKELVKVASADVSVVTYRSSTGPTRVELRTPSGRVNVGAIARKLGGGGHDKAAGFMTGTQDLEAIVEMVRQAWNRKE